MKKILSIVVIVIIAGLGWFAFRSSPTSNEEAGAAVTDHKNATYTIEGKQIKLTDGTNETSEDSGKVSTATSVTRSRYFGNELKTDLNGDGREDIAFILTQTSGGTGTFYYAVAALNTVNGYVGSDGYFLGDRIAPQSTTVSSDSRQKYVVVFNYANRAPGEPMAAQPTVGKSVYLKINPDTNQWGVVLSPEERESL